MQIKADIGRFWANKMKIETGSFIGGKVVCNRMLYRAIGVLNGKLGERLCVKLGDLEDMDFVKSEESCYILTDAGRIARL